MRFGGLSSDYNLGSPVPEGVELNFVTTDVGGGTVLQWADPFANVTDLVNKAIAKLKPDQRIKRLVIAGHGADHTSGFFVFDPDGAGVEVIDGSAKTNVVPSDVVTQQLARLKPYLSPDAVIELRVCRFGDGDAGARATQAIADATGATVTAPTDSISSLAAIGGLASDWRATYPTASGFGSIISFWRASTGKNFRPPQLPPEVDVAPVTAKFVPMRGTAFAAAAPATAPDTTVTVTPPPTPTTSLVAAGAAAGVVLAIIGTALGFNQCSPHPATNSQPMSAKTTYSCAGQSTLLFDNWNGAAVSSGATPPSFNTGGHKYCVVSIATYHWRTGGGPTPGSIGLTVGGKVLGPWKAVGQAGQNNTPNVAWVVNVPTSQPIILDGTFGCKDSDPSSWSQNSTSGGLGFYRVWVTNAVPG